MTGNNTTDKNQEYDNIKNIPKSLLDRNKTQEAFIFISEQNIPTAWKVSLLIGYAQKLNNHFSYEQIEFALRDHTTTDVG